MTRREKIAAHRDTAQDAAPSVPSPRRLALTLLAGIQGGRYGNLALDAMLARHPDMSEPDRRLLTRLTYGVIEREVSLDYVIGSLSSRPLSDIQPGVLDCVRLGLYQLIYMDRIPPHAAVSETVSLTQKSARGFVNALLHSFLRLKETNPYAATLNAESGIGTWTRLFPELESDPVLALSCAYGFPVPMTQRFMDVYGYDKTKSVLAALSQKPSVTLRINTLRISPDDFDGPASQAGFTVGPCGYLDDARTVISGNPLALDAHREGLFMIQDEASQICVKALDAKPGQTVVDVCSAPGSKSFGAAMDMNNSGTVYARDLHESKLSLIRSGADRLGLTVISADARDARTEDPDLVGVADRVLCDVPCSGLGVMAKKPEIRHKNPTEFTRLPDIQYAILETSSRYVKPGGLLLYSTCTLLPGENGDVVSRFLECHPEFEPDEFSFSPLPTASAERAPIRSERGQITLFPDLNGTDGFFIARMKRKK